MTSGVVDGVIVLEAHRLEGDGMPQFIRLLDDGLLAEGVLLAACHAGLQAHRVRNRDDPTRSCDDYLVSGVGEHAVRRHALLGPVPGGVSVSVLQGPVARAGQHAQDLGHRPFLLFFCHLLPVVAPVQSKTMTWRPTMSPRHRACMCSLMSSSLTLVTLCLIRPASASESTSTGVREALVKRISRPGIQTGLSPETPCDLHSRLTPKAGNQTFTTALPTMSLPLIRSRNSLI